MFTARDAVGLCFMVLDVGRRIVWLLYCVELLLLAEAADYELESSN